MDKRLKKRHSIHDVAVLCRVQDYIVRDYEQGVIDSLDFTTWMSLASYYGRDMLLIPFYIHSLERDLSDIYFMHLRAGEPIQFSCLQTMKEMKQMKETEC